MVQLTGAASVCTAAGESLFFTKKSKKTKEKTMTTHDAQLVPSTSSSGGLSPPGGIVACVCAPTRGKRTRGI